MVTTSESLANIVSDEVERQLKFLPREASLVLLLKITVILPLWAVLKTCLRL